MGMSASAYLRKPSPERLNTDLKQAMGKWVPVRTKAKLRNAANEHMAMWEKSGEREMSGFKATLIKPLGTGLACSRQQ